MTESDLVVSIFVRAVIPPTDGRRAESSALAYVVDEPKSVRRIPRNELELVPFSYATRSRLPDPSISTTTASVLLVLMFVAVTRT